jgi:CheY-like chemotaxis protein
MSANTIRPDHPPCPFIRYRKQGTYSVHTMKRMARDMTTRILVVDDEQDTLNLLKTILELNGCTAITTVNSFAAVELAEKRQPDVILLDIMMPKLGGFELCKMMRKNEAVGRVPIIFVTAYELIDMEERRIEAGADLVVYKPVDPDGLIAEIENVRESYQ